MNLHRFLPRNKHSHFFLWVLWFVFFNVLVAQVIALLYFYRTGLYPQGPWAWLYTFLYWNAHFATLATALLLIASVFLILSPFYILHRFLLPALTSFVLILLFIDTYVYAQYKFHINKFVLDLFLWGHGQVISFAWQSWVYMLSLAAGLFVMEFLAASFIWENLAQLRSCLSGWKIAAFYFFCILFMHASHIVADGMYYQPITRLDSLFPLSYPAYAQDLLMKYNLVDVEEYKRRSAFKAAARSDDRRLRYPIAPLHCRPPARKFNILWIAVDALRADMLRPEIMPQVERWSRDAQIFTRQMSNGNSTRYGIFGLFYGIPGSYFEAARASRTTPVLMDELRAQNYRLGIFGSAPLTKPEFDQTVFAKIPDLRTYSQGATEYQRDQDITTGWKSFLNEQPKGRPFFGFLFYDSPHGYAFPPQWPLRFQPSWDEVDYTALNQDFDPLPFLNRYKNSVAYVDSLIGGLLEDLRQRGLQQNTIVVLTSDHGQEFNDNHQNYWGHNSNFSTAQTHVPLVIAWPGMKAAVHDGLHSHYDLSVTFLQNALGCTNTASEFSSGENLFQGPPESWVLMASYDTYAIFSDRDIVAVNTAGNYEIVDQHYAPVVKPHLDSASLAQALRELGRFYQ